MFGFALDCALGFTLGFARVFAIGFTFCLTLGFAWDIAMILWVFSLRCGLELNLTSNLGLDCLILIARF